MIFLIILEAISYLYYQNHHIVQYVEKDSSHYGPKFYTHHRQSVLPKGRSFTASAGT